MYMYYKNCDYLKKIKQLYYKTSASVELTQTRHSHSKQLFQEGETDFSVSTGRVKKLHMLLVSLYF